MIDEYIFLTKRDDAQMVDFISSFLFPIAFIIFNILYWMVYLNMQVMSNWATKSLYLLFSSSPTDTDHKQMNIRQNTLSVDIEELKSEKTPISILLIVDFCIFPI